MPHYVIMMLTVVPRQARVCVTTNCNEEGKALTAPFKEKMLTENGLDFLLKYEAKRCQTVQEWELRRTSGSS
jgi:hypothetical protein